MVAGRRRCSRAVLSADPSGFSYDVRGGDVRISHRGRLATTLRGRAAVRFLTEIADSDEQQLMARATGNYKHGNERVAKHHPRNRG